MDTPTKSELLARIRERGPFADEAATENALQATLDALRAVLSSDERALLAAELPDDCARTLRASQTETQGTADFFEHVAERAGLRIGLATEQAQVVCRALTGALLPATRERLRRNLGVLGDLFAVPESAEPFDPSRLSHRRSVAPSDNPHGDTKLSSAPGLRHEQRNDTLASGRPGSKRPLSSAH